MSSGLTKLGKTNRHTHRQTLETQHISLHSIWKIIKWLCLNSLNNWATHTDDFSWLRCFFIGPWPNAFRG